jgi:hypothetical protein
LRRAPFDLGDCGATDARPCGTRIIRSLFQRGTVVKGVILHGVKPTERARLSAYEGDGYELERALAELPGQRRVRVFLVKPKPGAYTVTGRPWTLARWRLHHKPSEMRVVAETSLAPLAGRGLG